MSVLHSGWDIVMTKPGEYDSMKCRVCGEEMAVTRNAFGPTSSMGAMFGSKHIHDEFLCANAVFGWHDQVRRLREVIRDTPSAKLTAIYEEEIREILEKRKPTK